MSAQEPEQHHSTRLGAVASDGRAQEAFLVAAEKFLNTVDRLTGKCAGREASSSPAQLSGAQRVPASFGAGASRAGVDPMGASFSFAPHDRASAPAARTIVAPTQYPRQGSSSRQDPRQSSNAQVVQHPVTERPAARLPLPPTGRTSRTARPANAPALPRPGDNAGPRVLGGGNARAPSPQVDLEGRPVTTFSRGNSAWRPRPRPISIVGIDNTQPGR